MLRLCKQAVDPRLKLAECITTWFDISMQLRENHRQRRMQADKITDALGETGAFLG